MSDNMSSSIIATMTSSSTSKIRRGEGRFMELPQG
jgi:hypothetical protein